MLSDGTWTYTWEHGRELMTMSNGSTTWTNTYNADGLRTSRTNGSTTYSYVYNGSSLSQMTVGSNTLYFAYDASGTPMSVTYNGTNYYYATNLQGDVTAILNTSGTAVVQYTYDAWGKILTTTGDLASTLGAHNPLRYRAYVYDSETQLYYLQSRYYNPELCRFINADAFVSTGQGILGNNMFAYCGNNPVVHIDYSGNVPSHFSKFFDNGDSKSGNTDGNTVDLTEKLSLFMKSNAEKLREYYETHGFVAAALYFYQNVTDGGALDIKLQDDWKFEDGKAYLFNEMELRNDDPGNINLGYVGAVIFPEGILCLGAGLNQIKNWGFRFGNLSTFYDDPRDNKMIKYGYSLYWEDN